MIPIHDSNIVRLVPESTRVTDLIRSGKRLIWRQAAARYTEQDKAMSVTEMRNARREAEYVQRRNGVKEARLQLWKVPS